ncbi:MAG: hypothetical protein ABJO02_11125 [Reichenbachiella sp.]|uniref:hypothetical protein n=1 Tax=Reichenbachiella sp. TaxID=2184521 RepID=UPI003299DA50
MTPTKPSIISLIILFIGWFLIGLGYGDAVPAPLNTIIYGIGLVLFFGGLLATVYLVFR